ncbi:MAG TPA: PQQ-dependent sugar dehydrogenase [Verrucomicrobiota bacterium]|nr:PQQ-dependent sugar dehydrogenase [Verrucomicrobiota bacterium]
MLAKSVYRLAVIFVAVFTVHEVHGSLIRVPNSTLTNMPAVPGSFGYTFTNAFPFPGMVFTNPVCIASAPGETNRLFILEKSGRIIVITNLAAPNRTVFLNMTARVNTTLNTWDERGLLGLAFHPGYATNGYFYVFYTGNTNTTALGGGNGLHDIIARYQVSDANPNQANAASHTPILVQYDQADNHNGGDMHFGSDGYLYVSLGDEGGGNDSWNNSQTITKDFFAAFLRLDVDKRPGNLTPNPHHAVTTNYLVPLDNPYVGATNFNGLTINSNMVRTEFWAVGLRNPWRWCFDPETEVLYCGDVGQGAWEAICLIERGGNYGWAYREGFANGPKAGQAPPGFVHSPPLLAYPHTNANQAITGGRVYRGQKITPLYGAYVYADYNSGVFWALRHNGMTVTTNQLLFSDPGGVTAFGTDPSNGDILYCDIQSGQNGVIKRIIYNSTFTGSPIPPTLAGTGVFTNLATLEVATGIVNYDINVPFWSDNAIKTRWFSVPNTNLDITFNQTDNWSFPTGTVWIKHFDLEITNGVPESRRRIETRLLVNNQNGGYGVVYRWTTPPTNALLVGDGGLDEPITTYDSGGNVIATQTWHYPSRVECLACHTPAGGFALGFNTAQLNRDHDFGGSITNQIEALQQAGYFSNTVSNRHLLPALAHATNDAVSLEYRARSYLAANCAQCHQPSGSAQGMWDARISTSTPNTGLINGPLVNSGGDTNNRVIKPASLNNSMLLTRISTRGPGQMPPLASNVLDTNAIALISAWITNGLDGYQSFADWQMANFGSTNAPGTLPADDFDGDNAINELEYLTGTSPTNELDAWSISISLSNEMVIVTYPQIANRGFEVQSTPDLLGGAPWTPLDAPGNEPFYSITNRTALIPDPATETNKFYRVRVFEP